MGSTSFIDVNFVWGMITKSQFINLHSQNYLGEMLESNINSFGVTDTEAMNMIKKYAVFSRRQSSVPCHPSFAFLSGDKVAA